MLKTKIFNNKKSFIFYVLFFLYTKCYGSQVLEFSIEPSDVAVPEGNSALLQCAGKTQPGTLKEGKIAPNIRWRGPDGQDIGIVGDTFRTQSSNGSLYISSVEDNRGLTGLYQCLLSIDGIGTIVSRSARVSIAKFPDLNQDSVELYLSPGQTAYLQCIIGAVDKNGVKYSVTWIKDDMPLHFDPTRMQLLPSGALEIDEINLSDRGTYHCNLTSGSFSKLSSKTNLNIKTTGVPESFQAPIFATVPFSQTVREGDEVTLDCVANGNPKPQIKWLKSGMDIDMNDLDSRFRIIGTGSLQITAIEDSDSGNYQCRASNTIDSLDAAATIQVLVPPKFILSPSDKSAYVKEELELTCSIYGKPTPTVQWLKNGDLITPNDYMQIVNGNNLKILGLITSDTGMFQCIGTNPAGSIQSSARLQISETAQKVINSKYNKNIKNSKSKHNTNFTKTPRTTQSLFLTQNRDSKTIQKSALDSLVSKDRKTSDKTFEIKDFYENDNNDYDDDENLDDDDDEEDDAGSIHPWRGEDPNKLLNSLISGKNDHDDDDEDDVSYFSFSSLPPISRKRIKSDGVDMSQISRIPSAPRDLQAQIIKPRFVTLNWLEPLRNPDEVSSYTVFYKMNGSERERKINTKSRDDQEVNIQSLLPGKVYQFRVVANSNFGAGESSDIYQVDTQSEENIAGPPQNLKGTTISDHEIKLTWDPPLVTNGVIVQYRIYYAEEELGQEMFTDCIETEKMLIDLKPFTEYTISVVPFNQNGMGDPSNEIKVKTYSAPPSEAPVNVTLEPTSSTSITIRWEPPPSESRNGQITGYKIRYRKMKKALQVTTTPANIRHFEIINLEKMSHYQVRIAAININGTGPFSEWKFEQTLENDLDETKVPGVPRFLRTRPSAESIAVTWTSPAEQQIKVRGYVLGWGKGVPDEFVREMDENARYFDITGLEPNNEYVISLSSRNMVGDSPPVYDYVRTRDDIPVETMTPLEVPVGLRAITMSATAIVVYWTDTMLNKNQHVTDNRQYVVRYNPLGAVRYKYHNTSDLNVMINDLKPNTQYEFAVKVVKGKRESAWSMSVLNSTVQSLPQSPPRDVKARVDDTTTNSIYLTWSSPKHSSGLITGYSVFYTTNKSREDRDWSVQQVLGDSHNYTIKNLVPQTTYYFKIQPRMGKVVGPFSSIVSYKTGKEPVTTEGDFTSTFLNEKMFYIIAVCFLVTIVVIVIIVLVLLCRRKPEGTPEHAKKSYQKNNAGVKPPDLWIHHDQMELKNMEKSNMSNDGASSSGAMTLPRSVGHEYDTEPSLSHITNSLDKRTYVPGYITTPINSGTTSYPRNQYSLNRAHVSLEPTLSQQNLNQSQTPSLAQTPENPYGYDSMPSNYSNVTYAPGIPIDVPKRGPGHPLKSFSVPAPPVPTPVIPMQQKHTPAVTIRPQNASPYKKPLMSSSMANRLQAGSVVAHSTDEIQRLAPSTSTEELNQEMANLEGLMKDLSAITANEFEC